MESDNNLREPAVAGRFYPDSARVLEQTVNELMPLPPVKALIPSPHAIICPHAGYLYSGKLAAQTIASVKIPESVILLGPNHHGQGAPVALSKRDWNMVDSIVPINHGLIDAMKAQNSAITISETAHRFEHSLEVQIPLLRACQPALRIAPMVISQISLALCEEVGRAIATTIMQSKEDVLIVVSTDMSHYESRAVASKKDQLALSAIMRLDPDELYHTVRNENISMCGYIPTTIAIFAARLLGSKEVQLIDYTDSGAVSGDTEQVVGYAGLVIN
ncbi:MAG: AmmeMemoRadiSam system protein B [Desulfobulbaceae bacterium]|nr:MAG: AmmeMemoRadiSam system protein B [Desulfobulbaceae bacterium]